MSAFGGHGKEDPSGGRCTAVTADSTVPRERAAATVRVGGLLRTEAHSSLAHLLLASVDYSVCVFITGSSRI